MSTATTHPTTHELTQISDRLIEHNERFPNLVFAVLQAALGKPGLGEPYLLQARDIPSLVDVAEIAVEGGAAALLQRVEFDESGDPRNFELDEAAAAEVFNL